MNVMCIKRHEIGSFALRNYVLETSKGLIAIDTGYPGGWDQFVCRFEKIAPISKLSYVFLTHAHDDHAGFLKELLQHCDAQVILNPCAIPVLGKGENSVPEGGGYSSRLAALFGVFKKEFKFPPVNPGTRAVVVKDETDQFFERLGLPIQIVFLPGHTADSMGLLLTQTKELFCGDAAMNAVISAAKHTIWIDDKQQFQASWDKMISMQVNRIYPSHGNPFLPTALMKHRHFLDGRELIPM